MGTVTTVTTVSTRTPRRRTAAEPVSPRSGRRQQLVRGCFTSVGAALVVALSNSAPVQPAHQLGVVRGQPVEGTVREPQLILVEPRLVPVDGQGALRLPSSVPTSSATRGTASSTAEEPGNEDRPAGRLMRP